MKCIKIHTDLKNSEETAGIMPVESCVDNKLAVYVEEVCKYKCGLNTCWQKMARKLPRLIECDINI